jgi:hypothetical protein
MNGHNRNSLNNQNLTNISIDDSIKIKQRAFSTKYNEEFNNYTIEYSRQKNVLTKKLKDLENEFDLVKEKYEELAEENKEAMAIADQRLKNYKNIHDNLTKDQRLYYMDILKKGIDVRNEGLCWAVKRLLELDTPLDYSCFPRHLDHNQIDYLLRVIYYILL